MSNKPILAVLIVISALNLALTTWLVIDSNRPNQLSGAKQTSPLPAELSASKRDAIFEQVKNLYNTQDYDGLYAIFAREVQVQIPKDQFIASMDKLRATFSDIEDGAYSYYEFVGNRGGRAFYNLYYTVRLSKSAISPKGSLKITVVVVEGNVAVYGIYLNSITQ
jgi:hypothetical protein